MAAGGDLDDLRAQLVALRLTEDPPGLDEAEQALDDLQAELGSPPRVATPERLDRVGAATRRLEVALGGEGGSPFAAAMKGSGDAVQAFVSDVETAYKLPLGCLGREPDRAHAQLQQPHRLAVERLGLGAVAGDDEVVHALAARARAARRRPRRSGRPPEPTTS